MEGRIYLDGIYKGRKELSTSKIRGNGELIIGNNFIGLQSGLNIWDRELSEEEIKSMKDKCSPVASGAILKWSDVVKGTKHGKVSLISSNSCKDSKSE